MERLTEKHYLGTDHYMKCSGNCNVDMDCIDCPSFDRLVERLAAYEDTGLEPEEVLPKDKADEIALKLMRLADLESICNYTRLRELAEADRDGRMVTLPCKVGDTVYFRTYDCNGTVDLGIQPHKVTAIVWNAIVRGRYIDVGLPSGQYGVSWFLTREEAEKALEVTKNE